VSVKNVYFFNII